MNILTELYKTKIFLMKGELYNELKNIDNELERLNKRRKIVVKKREQLYLLYVEETMIDRLTRGKTIYISHDTLGNESFKYINEFLQANKERLIQQDISIALCYDFSMGGYKYRDLLSMKFHEDETTNRVEEVFQKHKLKFNDDIYSYMLSCCVDENKCRCGRPDNDEIKYNYDYSEAGGTHACKMKMAIIRLDGVEGSDSSDSDSSESSGSEIVLESDSE